MPEPTLRDRLAGFGVVPVVEIVDVATAVPLARTLVEAGLGIIEVTFRTAAALEAIRRIRAEVPEMIVGAGTVLDEATVARAVSAHAHFLVSPGLTEAVVAAAARAGCPIIAGVATASEIEHARNLGLRLVKFFPAVASGGIDAVRAFAGPYSDVSFMPTGGITPGTLGAWLEQPNIAACGGTWIAPRALIAERRFDEIGVRAHDAVRLVAEARSAVHPRQLTNQPH